MPGRAPSIEKVVVLAPGARLGPYEILSPLGAGGMGEVYPGPGHAAGWLDKYLEPVRR